MAVIVIVVRVVVVMIVVMAVMMMMVVPVVMAVVVAVSKRTRRRGFVLRSPCSLAIKRKSRYVAGARRNSSHFVDTAGSREMVREGRVVTQD